MEIKEIERENRYEDAYWHEVIRARESTEGNFIIEDNAIMFHEYEGQTINVKV